MHNVLVLLASNYRQEQHLSQARKALAQVLSSCCYTEAIWTEPEGSTTHNGQPEGSTTPNGQPEGSVTPNDHTEGSVTRVSERPLYLNQLLSARTDLDADSLVQRLKQIECELGRNDGMRRQGLVPIDLDLLQHDDQRYHQRDWQRSYVQRLLPLLADGGIG